MKARSKVEPKITSKVTSKTKVKHMKPREKFLFKEPTILNGVFMVVAPSKRKGLKPPSTTKKVIVSMDSGEMLTLPKRSKTCESCESQVETLLGV